MQRVAKFEKVTKKQFKEGVTNVSPIVDMTDEIIDSMYEAVEIPTRATSGSAGYDFHIPFGITLTPGSTVTVPTGIRAKMEDGWVLMIFPRSGLGFKYRLRLNNTVGVIDADYYNSDNEGHIMVKITNESDKTFTLAKGDRFAQGVFLPFGITEDDNADGVRNGGMSSTGK